MTALLFVALLFSPQAAPPPKCSLTGTVVNQLSGEPLNKTEVVAEAFDGKNSATTTTDAAGRFTLVDIEPGQYKLLAHRNGYLEARYGSKRDVRQGATLTLSAGDEMKGLEIRATPFGVIAGTIRDSDGEPVSGVNVAVFGWVLEGGRRKIERSGEATSDDLGHYRLTGLTPGRYYVYAQPDEPVPFGDHSPVASRPRELPIATFHPSAADPGAASQIEVGPGARVNGIDVVLLRSRLFRVFVRVEAPAGMSGDARLTYSIPGFGDIGRHFNKNEKGVEFRNVPAGSWVLDASAGDPKKSTPGTWIIEFDKNSYNARVPIHVAEDISDFRVVVNAGAEISGHVTVEGAKAPGVVGANIFYENGEGGSVIRSDNTFAAKLSPGHYQVDFSGITSGDRLYVKSVHADSRDILREGLTVRGSGKISIEAVLSSEGGEVEGVVYDKDDKPVSGATVVLVPPPDLRERRDFFKQLTTDQNGKFTFKGVAPADYKVFAWEDVENGAWFDAAFLKNLETKAEPVGVEAGGHQIVKTHLSAASN